jgi:serine/threonine protein kinase
MSPPPSTPPAPPSGGPTSRGPVPGFRATALASGLVDAMQLDAAEDAVAGAIGPQARSDASRWDTAVADWLVSRAWLTQFQADQLLAGRRKLTLGQYRILDELGRGGMGQVFRAEHALMGRTVAIKVLPRAKSTADTEAAFQREIRMLARLDHPHLVRALDAGHDGKVYYLVTELVPGLDLRRQVLRHGPLDEIRAASVVAQAALGLAYAHGQGLVHRDVKPANLLVTPEGHVRVLDLGLAGSVLEAESTRLGRVVGTMDFMAPEQIRAPDGVGPSADMYALGCTLFFALTGEVPFPGGTRQEKARRHLKEEPRSVRQLAPTVSEGMDQVVTALLRKEPQARPTSAADVVERLRPWLPAEPLAMPRGKQGRADASRSRRQPPPLPSPSSTGQDTSLTGGQSTRGLLSAIDETDRLGTGAPSSAPRGSPFTIAWHWLTVAIRSLLVAAAGAASAAFAVWQLGPASVRGGGPTGGGVPGAVGWTAFGVLLATQLLLARGRGPGAEIAGSRRSGPHGSPMR